jgi:hypothetical protein
MDGLIDAHPEKARRSISRSNTTAVSGSVSRPSQAHEMANFSTMKPENPAT